jgi:hypothetical protein
MGTYVVHRCDQVVLIAGHVEFSKDISVSPFVHNHGVRDLRTISYLRFSRGNNDFTFVASILLSMYITDNSGMRC